MVIDHRIRALTDTPLSSLKNNNPAPSTGGANFAEILKQRAEESGEKQVAFSKHALARAEERGVEITPTLLDKLTTSVEKATEKGATNILAMDNSKAFIVNVPNYKVITTISQEEMKENIFTNIDGAVFL